MALKDILVHLDDSEQSATRLRVALDLARRHDAHLTGLHVIDPVIYDPMIYPDAAGIAVFIDQIRSEAESAAQALEQAFRERLRVEGVAGEWRLAEGRSADVVALLARYADMTILGQQNPDEPRLSGWGAVIEQALFSSGRPVLVVPYAGTFTSVAHKVLVGWNASREAARAVNDALPLIAAAESTVVLTIGDPGERAPADIALHLARHGLSVTAEHTTSGGLNPGDILLNYTADHGSDLLVIGAYGHSRVRELVMGGVTRTLLQHMTVPVLMSH